MRIFDRSLRHKIPLWGGALIVASAVAVSGAQMVRAYADLKRDTINSSEGLGHTLAKTLFPALLHDDAWRAFELIRAPFHEGRPEQPLEARAIFVVDADLRVLVSSAPRAMPLLAPLDTLGADERGYDDVEDGSLVPDALNTYKRIIDEGYAESFAEGLKTELLISGTANRKVRSTDIESRREAVRQRGQSQKG